MYYNLVWIKLTIKYTKAIGIVRNIYEFIKKISNLNLHLIHIAVILNSNESNINFNHIYLSY